MRAFRSRMPSLKVASVWLLRTRNSRGRPPAGDSVINLTTWQWNDHNLLQQQYDYERQAFLAPTGALSVMVQQATFDIFIQPTPQYHNICSKSPEHHKCNSGQLMQCLQVMHQTNKQTRATNKQSMKSKFQENKIIGTKSQLHRTGGFNVLMQQLCATNFTCRSVPTSPGHANAIF